MTLNMTLNIALDSYLDFHLKKVAVAVFHCHFLVMDYFDLLSMKANTDKELFQIVEF